MIYPADFGELTPETCPFPIDMCPLCGVKLNADDNREAVWCSTIATENSTAYRFHYYVDDYAFQNVIIPPYLFWSRGDMEETMVYHSPSHDNDYEQLISLPRITDWSNIDKIISRVKSLKAFI